MSILETAVFARKVLDHLIAHPEEHEQQSFGRQYIKQGVSCGTTMCIAGTTAALDSEVTPLWVTVEGRLDLFMDGVDTPDGPRDIEAYAAEKLGMKWSGAQKVFYEFDNAKALDKFTQHVEGLETQAALELSRAAT